MESVQCIPIVYSICPYKYKYKYNKWPFRPVEKISLISSCTAAKILSSFCIILTKQQTLSVTRPFDSSLALYYKRPVVTMHLSCTVMEIWRLKDNGVMSLTFRGHVTSSVTWPFESRRSSSYGWSIVTMRPSGTVKEIWLLKDNGVTSLTFCCHATTSVTKKRWKKGKKKKGEKEERETESGRGI